MTDNFDSQMYSGIQCRQTKLRMALGHIFHHSTAPISVPEIQNIFKSKNFKVNKTSIYRELKFLVKNFILNEIQIDGVSTKYEFNDKNKKAYLICAKCDKITPIEINQQILDNEIQKISKKYNFDIHRHSLIFFGHCHKCQ